MSEPLVAATDYALVLECAAFAVVLRGRAGDPVAPSRRWWQAFFGATAGAAFLGGTYHGFFPGAESGAGAALWVATMLSIGVTGFAALELGRQSLMKGRAPSRPLPSGRPSGASLARSIGLMALTAYVLAVVAGVRSFALAVAYYLPATLFWLVMLVRTHLERRDRASLLGAIGLATSFVAAAVQTLRVSLPALGLDHNSLYHVIQALALLLLFRCAAGQLRSAHAIRDDHGAGAGGIARGGAP